MLWRRHLALALPHVPVSRLTGWNGMSRAGRAILPTPVAAMASNACTPGKARAADRQQEQEDTPIVAIRGGGGHLAHCFDINSERLDNLAHGGGMISQCSAPTPSAPCSAAKRTAEHQRHKQVRFGVGSRCRSDTQELTVDGDHN